MEQAEREGERIRPRDGRHGTEIEETVVDAGSRGNPGVVAVLVGVGDSEREGAPADGAAGVRDGKVQRLPLAKGGGGGAEIAEEAAARELVEALSDLRLEPEAGGGEKGMPVGQPGIDQPGPAVQEEIESARRVAVETEVAAEAVAGAARHEAERRGRGGEDVGDLVHGPVAADGDNQLAAVAERLPGEFRGVPGPVGQHDAGPVAGGEEADGREALGGAAGAEVDDESRFQRGKSPLTTDYTDATDGKNKTGPRRAAVRPVPAFMPPILHVLTGPTAVGKTEWALRWAEQHDAEIVSCDSLLFYRGMDLGTAKPTAAERARVPHHLIDVAEAADQASVTRYVAWARAAVDAIRARGRAVLVTGGSGFYLKAFFAPVADELAVPAEIRARVARLTLPEAVAELRALNPAGLGALDVANPRRVARALERGLASGRTVAELAAEFARQPKPFGDFHVRLTRLDRAPAELERRIGERVAAMLAGGLIEEVRRLRAAGFERNPSAAGAIGYREVIAVLDGRLAEADLAAEIGRNTRALVKKQRTWFRTQLPPHRVIDAATLGATDELFAE